MKNSLRWMPTQEQREEAQKMEKIMENCCSARIPLALELIKLRYLIKEIGNRVLAKEEV